MTAKKNIILEKDSPVLRQVARPVPKTQIGSHKIREVLRKMSQALHAEADGVAIAAPQIGESLRIFIINTEALVHTEEPVNQKVLGPEDLVFINPEVIRASKKKHRVEEGCLSIRWLYGKVLRHEKISVRALDAQGKVFEKGASGLLAQILQHETDHLNGILFIDKATEIENIPPSTPQKSFVKTGQTETGTKKL